MQLGAVFTFNLFDEWNSGNWHPQSKGEGPDLVGTTKMDTSLCTASRKWRKRCQFSLTKGHKSGWIMRSWGMRRSFLGPTAICMSKFGHGRIEQNNNTNNRLFVFVCSVSRVNGNWTLVTAITEWINLDPFIHAQICKLFWPFRFALFIISLPKAIERCWCRCGCNSNGTLNDSIE